MTAHKHLKQLVRARMLKTGESYSTARRHVIRDEPEQESDPALRHHSPGNVPASAALRMLLSQANISAPHTKELFSEAMAFGIAGGIGMGVFAFHYAKENFSSFFIAGRHRWADDEAYLTNALRLFGVQPEIRETSSPVLAAKQLAEALDEHGPCVAWVDMTFLPHRAVPLWMAGMGYHIITVYAVRPEEGIALIGDLADEPIEISLDDLAASRGRITKQKNRLLSVTGSGNSVDLPELVRKGLASCHDELMNPTMKAARGNFQLGAINTLAERIHGSKDKESWDNIFPRGGHLWTGLTSLYKYVEHYGSGGGLSRPLFSDFLREANEANALDSSLAPLIETYAELGQKWSELADAALPDDVPIMREAKELTARRSELTLSGGSSDEVRAVWEELDVLAAKVKESFPLSESESEDLRADLKKRLLALHAAEEAALNLIGQYVRR